MLQTFLVSLHFDGSRFVGWQRQPSGRSVQAEVEKVLERLAGHRIPAHAAGRTDAGVHAVGMGVSFAMAAKWAPDTLRRALNALLPNDCWAESADRMRPGFHARKSALSRRYRYDVGTDAASASPFRRPYEWALARRLEPAQLQAAADVIVGEHNFRAFAAKGQDKPHYRCRIRLAEWEPRAEGRGVSFHVEADRFLHHMVRMLVGTMVDVGLARRPPGDMRELLERQDNAGTSPPAPPQGLYFVAATYPADCFADAPPREAGLAVSTP
jgi:tRNA pseudouridine38-40 synthase